MSGNITIHMGDNALRQVVSLDLIGQSQVAQLGSTIPVAADNALDQAFMAIVVAASAIAMALTSCEEQSQVTGMTGFQEPLLQSAGQSFGAGAANKTTRGDGIAVIDHQRCFLSSDHTNFLHVCLPSFILKFKIAYLFWKFFSLRFSRNAPMPSFWSAVA